MDYKTEKEQFVSGGKGSSTLEVVGFWVGLLLTHLLWRSIPRDLSGLPVILRLAIEFLLLVFPVLAFTTLVADRLWYANLLLCLAVGFCLSFKPSQDLIIGPASKLDTLLPEPFDSLHDDHAHHRPSSNSTATSESLSIGARESLRQRGNQSYKLLVNDPLIDRPTGPQDSAGKPTVFPRRFAKTESWGVSLMDSGVGSFVFSLGIVSALPILRRTPTSGSVWREIWGASKKTMPMVGLGLGRVVLVKQVAYPEHETEYGTHWNFFFTLSILPMTGVFARRLYEAYGVEVVYAGLVVGLVQQAVLSLGGLQAYVLSAAPRAGVVAANREGLASMPGYATIYLLGLSSGCYLLPPAPDFLAKRRAGTPQPGKALVVYASWTIVWWTLYAAARALGAVPSRRLANPSYCLWIVANNSAVILGNALVHHLLPPSPPSIPYTFALLNRNSLPVFLLANLLTGAVNLAFHSIHLPPAAAFTILLAYSLLIVGFAWVIRGYKFKL